VSPDRDPLERPGSPTGRLVAVGTAALVTLLTVAGMVGIGPGAAQAQMNRDDDARSTASDEAAKEPQSKPHSDPGSSGSTSSDDDWLTINDDPPAHDPHQSTGPHSDGPSTSTALPPGSGTGKRIVYDISDQRVWLVGRQDKVNRTYLVSGGKDPTLLEPGRYAVTSMSPEAVSYNHKETMQYMVRFATGDHAPIGFHDVPARQDGSLVQSRAELGTPLSSGCIRQWITDARALWDFATVDTPVVVTA
jgi:lipoprotein-anchoring transpeptidase ErfK/SrfK